MSSLSRTLRLHDLILLIVGTVIGSGIFIVPGTVLRQLNGSFTAAMLAWTCGGILSLLGALTYGELGAVHPKVGGIYVYIRDSFGLLPAFLYGWALFFIISTGSIATLALAFSSYIGELVPTTPATAKLIAIGMVAAATTINVGGTRQSTTLQNWATLIKLGAIIIMSVVLLSLSVTHATPSVGSVRMGIAGGFGPALISVLWAYEGWQYCTFAAGEILDPQRTFPRAFLIGTAILIIVYLFANVSYYAALGAAGMANSDRVAVSAMSAAVHPFAAKVVAIVIALSILSATNGLIMTSPRVYFAMANDKLFFSRLAQVHPRYKTPAFAIISGSAWAVILITLGTFEQMLTYVIFVGWLFYALGAAAIFFYRRQRTDVSRPYSVPGYPWSPLLFILTAMALVVGTVISQPRRAGAGAALLVGGVPVFFVWREWNKRRHRDSAPQRRGGSC